MRIVTIVLLAAAACLVAILIYGFIRTRIIVSEVEAKFPPIGQFATVLGERVHYVDIGPRDAPPQRTILLLHGASANLRDPLTPVGAPLSKTYRVIAIDRPGHGWSSRALGRADAQLARQADIVAAVLKQIGVARAVVLGHSWGGALAMRLALDHPDAIIGVILVSPVTHPWPGGVGWVNDVAVIPVLGALIGNTIIAPIGTYVIPKALEKVFAPSTPSADYVATTGVELVLRPTDGRANAEDLVDLKPQIIEQAKRYPAFKRPLLVITGDSDGIVSPVIHAQAIARDVEGAELVTLDGSGHVPLHSRTAEVLALIDRFMARLNK